MKIKCKNCQNIIEDKDIERQDYFNVGSCLMCGNETVNTIFDKVIK